MNGDVVSVESGFLILSTVNESIAKPSLKRLGNPPAIVRTRLLRLQVSDDTVGSCQFASFIAQFLFPLVSREEY